MGREASQQCLKGLRRKDKVFALNLAAGNYFLAIALRTVRAFGLD
jgi:protein tyrosine/serine phosphatase